MGENPWGQGGASPLDTQALQNIVLAINNLTQVLGALSPTFVPVPATVTSSGVPYQIAADTSFLYICVASNVWRRVAISTF